MNVVMHWAEGRVTVPRLGVLGKIRPWKVLEFLFPYIQMWVG